MKKSKYLKSQLQEGEELCFSCSKVEQDLDLVENALIFAQKPSLNEKGKDNYAYDEAHLVLSGSCTGMKYTDFTIR